MCPVPCPGIIVFRRWRLSLLSPKICTIVSCGLDHVCWGRQPCRVLNVITTRSCWKCGGSGYDLVVSGVCPLSHLGLYFLWRNRKNHDKIVQSEGRKREQKSTSLWMLKCKMRPVSCVSCLLWLDFLCSLNFLPNLNKLSQFESEDGSVGQKWHILKVLALAAVSHQIVWLMGSLLLFGLKTEKKEM